MDAPYPGLEPPPRVDLQRTTLFLDLDGTLAPFEVDPLSVGPTPCRSALIKRLSAALGGRLAIVSGRSLEEIDRILDGQARCAAGLHGLQHRTTRRQSSAEAHPALASAEAAMARVAAAHPGVFCEAKGLSVALHYRARPDLALQMAEAVRPLERDTGLTLQRGDHVLELRTPGADKGDAVRAFMTEPPFKTGQPVFIGDDLSDESGFRAVSALGGFGVLVGERRRTAARYSLQGVDAVLDWLAALSDRRAEPTLIDAHV